MMTFQRMCLVMGSEQIPVRILKALGELGLALAGSYALKDVIDNNLPSNIKDNIYLIRDGEVIFYIGQSSFGGAYRVIEHFDNTARSNSTLHELMMDNLPKSLLWSVDLVSIPGHDEIDRQDFECALITALSPCINIHCNDTPSRLPSNYTSQAKQDAIREAAAKIDVPFNE